MVAPRFDRSHHIDAAAGVEVKFRIRNLGDDDIYDDNEEYSPWAYRNNYYGHAGYIMDVLRLSIERGEYVHRTPEGIKLWKPCED